MFGYPPLLIFVGGQKLTGYTRFSMSRSKKDLTGSCSIDLFFAYIPDKPIFAAAIAGAPIQVYVGGEIAFNGTVDSREGVGEKKQNRDSRGRFQSGFTAGGSASISIDSDSYTMSIKARGKTKQLINGSHQHKTTNMKSPTTKTAVEALTKAFGVLIDWRAAAIKLDRLRFRDGSSVYEELVRIGSEYGHFIYETRDGKLRVTDGPSNELGEDIVLGDNILSFSSSQSEAGLNSEIQVKGQLSDKGSWGEKAVLKGTIKILKDFSCTSYCPKTIQYYGNGTPDALERRARFEANKRCESAKAVTVDVFHIQSRTGAPWDVGTLHYVEIPPEGVFDVMECTGIEYTVEAEKTLKTRLTLSPVPASGASSKGLSAVGSALSAKTLLGASRRAAAGVTLVAGFSWGGPVLGTLTELASASLPTSVRGLAAVATSVVAVLPASFKEPSK